MPKLTVYVPDGLVERVRELNPEVNVSQLLQNAVQTEIQRLEAQRDGATAVRDRVNLAAMREKFQAARNALTQAERAAYVKGYGWVLAHAEAIPYWVFEGAADPEAGYTPRSLATAMSVNDEPDNLDALRGFAHDDAEAGGLPSIVYQGAHDALRAVWTTIDAELAGESLPVEDFLEVASLTEYGK